MSEVHHKPAFDNAEPARRRAVIETGIDEFSTYGFENANINVIAKKAGMSVGLMYKYFETKEDLFITCMDEAISVMDNALNEIVATDGKLMDMLEQLIRTVQKTSRENEKYLKLYNEITKLSSADAAEHYSKRIESISHNIYVDVLKNARDAGQIRSDCDLDAFTFFFDSIITTLQFSYSCDYYKERMKVFCGEDVFDDDEKVIREIMKFLESAFTFEHEDVKKFGK